MKKNIFIVFLLLQGSLWSAEGSSCELDYLFKQKPGILTQKEKMMLTDINNSLIPKCMIDNTYYSPQSNFELLDCFRQHVLLPLINSEGKWLGCVIFHKEPNNVLYIDYLTIHRNHQKKGYGTYIIDELFKEYQPASIELLSTEDALPFYRKQGFTSIDHTLEVFVIKHNPYLT